MEKDDFDWDDYTNTAGMGPRVLPVQATELLGSIGSQILRSLLVAAPDDIPEDYACSPEQAAVALACCELAELSVWDEAALIEAATIGACEEQRLMWGCESRDRLARRISLAMKAEKAPEVMSPADGVLLLHRAGIHVFHQLADAVAVMTIHTYTPESQSLYRHLNGIAEPQHLAPAQNTAKHAPEVAVNASGGVKSDKAGPVDRGWVMKKFALIAKHNHQWKTINRDFQDAIENGLSGAAKAPGHGNWFEAAALIWARQRGKLTEDTQQGPASISNVWTVKTHTIDG